MLLKKYTMLAVVIVLTFSLNQFLTPSRIVEAQLGSPASINQFNIIRVGEAAFNNAAEFGPLIIGRASVVPNASLDVLAAEVLPLTSIINYSSPYPGLPRTFSYENFSSTNNVTLEDARLISGPIYGKDVNYFEASFRPISGAMSTLPHLNPPWNGITWNDGHKNYYAFLRTDQLVLFREDRVLSGVPGEIAWAEAVSNIGEWNTIQVAYVDNVIHIFLNGVPKVQVEVAADGTNATSKGISCGFGSIMPC